MAIESRNYHYTADSVKELLVQHGIKRTSQRIEIGKMLLSSPQHLSADQVLSRVNQGSEIVSKATVYNTLYLFVEKGLIRQVITCSGKVFYDSNTSPHFHLYNEDSGELMDFDAGQMKFDNKQKLPEKTIASCVCSFDCSIPGLPENTIASGVDVIIKIKNKI
jgi:Fur family iron response transcriptional regulator